MKSYCLYLIAFFLFISCSNKANQSDPELEAAAASANALAEDIMDSNSSDNADYVEPDKSHMWEKGYLKNDFEEEDKSSPFIESTFYGKMDSDDCELKITFCDKLGAIFEIRNKTTLTGGANLWDCVVKVKLEDQVFQLEPTEYKNSSILFQDPEQVGTIITLLECGKFFKIAIINTDVSKDRYNYVFEIYGDTGVRKALKGIGVNL